MANIKMCDFCGKVSNRMAAEVLIRPVGGYQHADVLSERARQVQRNITEYQEPEVKDCCEDCFGQFNQVREIKILESSGDL